MRNRRGRIIYVGKAASLRKRVASYFRDAALRRASPKLRGLVKSVADLDWLTVRTEAEAILAEGRLIKEYKPHYNVSFKDDKRFLMLRGDPREPFPRLRTCRLERDDGARYFGPYVSSAAARATLDFVEKRYGLRKCTPRVPDADTYRHCINDIVRFCAAPCVGKTGAEEYRRRFDEACAFLRGERSETLKEIRQRMTELAERHAYEEAAALRDTLLMLTATVRQRTRVAATPAMKREDARRGVAALREALGLEAPPRTIEAFDISNISGTYAVGSMVCVVDGWPERRRYRRFRIRSALGLDDTGMLAEVVRRRYARLLDERQPLPDLVLVDGGAGQTGAARAALDGLGLAGLPVAGLAKRFEDIYRPGRSRPLRLPRDSAALRVLQRLRDEAHRFALDYHHRLRSRRLRESVLEEIPGIGEKKKAALFERFGSVRRLANAAEAEVAAVPGIGARTARLIMEHLGRAEA
ncbi:MAG: excinuclease ABC subunit UvrC [Lentisphaerae bacterium]|nr:excinuclease ABC subunit UvrC [Lentisphaerota bacterium]